MAYLVATEFYNNYCGNFDFFAGWLYTREVSVYHRVVPKLCIGFKHDPIGSHCVRYAGAIATTCILVDEVIFVETLKHIMPHSSS